KVPGVLAVMATAGLYDDSGQWLYHTGLPAKSGVGGGMIAVSPRQLGVGVGLACDPDTSWIAAASLPLDDAGNSVRAQRAIAAISNAIGGNPYVARKESGSPPVSTRASASFRRAAGVLALLTFASSPALAQKTDVVQLANGD